MAQEKIGVYDFRELNPGQQQRAIEYRAYFLFLEREAQFAKSDWQVGESKARAAGLSGEEHTRKFARENYEARKADTSEARTRVRHAFKDQDWLVAKRELTNTLRCRLPVREVHQVMPLAIVG